MIYEISMIYGNGGGLSIQACVDILVEHTDGMRMRGWNVQNVCWNVQDICWNVQNINIMRVGMIITWKSLSARHSGQQMTAWCPCPPASQTMRYDENTNEL